MEKQDKREDKRKRMGINPSSNLSLNITITQAVCITDM